MARTILLPHDGSRLAERAVPFAAALAKASGARIVLFREAEVFSMDQLPELEVTAVAERLRAQGVTADPVVDHLREDDVPAAILEAARAQHADLVVMSTHGRGGLGRWLYGSVADRVLRDAELPVLLVPAAAERPWPGDRPLRVLVPLDGSELAESALEAVERLVTLASTLHLLRVVELPTYAEAFSYSGYSLEAGLADAQVYLEDLAEAKLPAERSREIEVRGGFPAVTIDILAREREIDLIAMATHGRGGLARLVLGSVAARVLQRAVVPLLVVRPPAMRRPAERPAAPVGAAAEARPVPLSAEELGLLVRALDLLVAAAEHGPVAGEAARSLRRKLEQAELAALVAPREGTGGGDDL